MKTVFSTTKEVSHIWAQQNQTNGRSGHVFFRDQTIFSYGEHFPIAKFYGKDTVLFTTRDYSVTTQSHKSDVRGALQGLPVKVIRVRDVLTLTNTYENLISLRDEIQQLQRKSINAVKNGGMYRGETLSAQANLGNYLAFLKKQKIAIPSDLRRLVVKLPTAELFTEKEIEKLKTLEKECRAVNKKRLELEKKELLIRIEEWKAGKNTSIGQQAGTFLRINGDDVETSRGARVPLPICRRLWERMKKGTGVNGMSLGSYTVNGLRDGCLKVGCHSIPVVEMERISAVLGWGFIPSFTNEVL